MANGPTTRFGAIPQGPAGEQQALQNILEAPELGGAAVAGGRLGAGADVPAQLEQDPALRQLLQEAILTQTGQTDRAVQSSRDFVAAQDQPQAPQVSAPTAQSDVVTSQPAQTQFDQNVATLDALAAQNQADIAATLQQFAVPDLQAPDFQAEQDLIQRQRDLISTNLENQIASIQADFAKRREEQEFANRAQQGATQALVARTGASTFASGQGAVTAEVKRGQEALNQLTALENQAIQAAKAAAAGADTELLQASIAAAERAFAAKNQIRQQTFENIISSQQAAADLLQQETSRAQSTINTLGSLSPQALSSIDPAQLQQLESQAGLPTGFFDAFQQTQLELADAQSSEAQFERGTELLNLALKLPSGTQFDLGGTTVTGLDVGDRKVFQSKDNQGNVTFTTVDPATGALVNSVSVPGIGVATGGTGGGGGTARRSGGVSAGIADVISGGAALLNQVNPNTNAPYTPQEVFQLSLQNPAVAGDPKAQEQVLDALFGVVNLGNDTEFIRADEGQLLVPFNPTTGTTGTAIEVQAAEEEQEGGGAGQFFSSAVDLITSPFTTFFGGGN